MTVNSNGYHQHMKAWYLTLTMKEKIDYMIQRITH